MMHVSDKGFKTPYTCGKYGLVDKKGNEVLPCIYDEIMFCCDGDTIAVRLDDKWGVFNQQGNEILKCIHDEVFCNTNCIVVTNNGKEGMFDNNGNEIIKCHYQRLGIIYDRYIPAKENGKWGYIDTNDNVIIEFMYDCVGCYINGMFAVKRDNDWGFVDKNNEIRIPFVVRFMLSNVEDNEFVIVLEGRLARITDEFGSISFLCSGEHEYIEKVKMDIY